MDVDWLPLDVLGSVSGWTLFIASIFFFGRLLSKGQLLTMGQREDLIAHFTERLEEQKSFYEFRLSEAERNRHEFLAAVRALYDARLVERDELIDEARENVAMAMKTFGTYGVELSTIADFMAQNQALLSALRIAATREQES